jgi:glycosyltransferase involved in cell wall biosynthesis
MMNTNAYQFKIPPVPDGILRPLWSVMIPTYNCAKYLRETLKSVLAQDPGSEVMQIEVIDDYSTQDDPEAIVKELGCGRVGFYRQSENVGHIQNFQTCLERSRGKFIHLLHGDDCVQNGFYRLLQKGFEQDSKIGAAFCRHIHIDEQGLQQYVSDLEQPESGILHNWLEKIAVKQLIQTPAIAVRRDVYEDLGIFDSRLSSCEDWEMWIRIAAKYPVWYEPELLALYRVRSNSNTERHLQSGKEIQNIRKVIGITKEYLPDKNAHKLTKNALENYAFYGLLKAQKFISNGDNIAGMKLIIESLKCSSSLKNIRQILKIIIAIFYRQYIKTKPIDNSNI